MTDDPNVIDIAAERAKRQPGKPERGPWLFSMDVYLPIDPTSADPFESLPQGGVTAFNTDAGLTPGNRMRHWAGRLEELARMLRDSAHAIEPDDDGKVLCIVQVWESSRVRTWTNTEVRGPARVDWLRRRLDEAKVTVEPPEERPRG